MPVTYKSSQGVKTGSESTALIDGKTTTFTTFNSEIMNVSVDVDE